MKKEESGWVSGLQTMMGMSAVSKDFEARYGDIDVDSSVSCTGGGYCRNHGEGERTTSPEVSVAPYLYRRVSI